MCNLGLAFSASSCLLTESSDAGNSDRLELSSEMDPYGILLKVAKEERLVHTQDNVVAYFERVKNEEKG